MKPTPEQVAKVLKLGREDPEWWVRTILGDDPWPEQVRILEAVRDHKEVAVRSCHGIGKDWIAARVVLWFLYTHRPSIVISTGPTDRQVKGILWKEIGIAHSRARFPLAGRCLTQELKLDRDWWAWGFTAPHKDPERFQGFHESNVLVVVDEACGVSQEIYLAIDGVLTSSNAKKLEIGNPTDVLTPFGESFKTPGIHKIEVSAFDTLNFTTFGITKEDIANDTWQQKITGELPYPQLVTPDWVATRYKRWGPESPFYLSRVLGEFPSSSPDALIPLSWIEQAQQRELKPGEPVELGVDVARSGTDKSVIAERRGSVVRVRGDYAKLDTMATTGHTLQALKETGAERAKIDVVGIGAGVVDRGKELKQPFVGANAGAKARDPERFVNARAEWFWGLRERFERGDIDLDPADEDLAHELAMLRWKPDSQGRVAIEAKEDMKKRLGRSPDRADAVAIAFADVGEEAFFGIWV
ncbi:MAG: hypothetical protein AMJ46_12575 [Latescibacteria bacterium DG_63]|nr:MAG: hypothetical protein AMJ46_12575 [Latescibacteria bacterium DG_63]